MDSNRYISIIMPAYNAEDSIGAAIRSVQQQTYQNYELIIIDDCSTDHTHEIVEAFAAEDSRIKLILNEKNMGALLHQTYWRCKRSRRLVGLPGQR